MFFGGLGIVLTAMTLLACCQKEKINNIFLQFQLLLFALFFKSVAL